MEQSKKKPIMIFTGIVLAITLFGCLLAGTSIDVSHSNYGSTITTDEFIAVVNVEGVIGSSSGFIEEASYNHQFTLDAIDELISDPQNKGLMLHINSPGGGVYESDELYLKIKEYQETTARPVYSYLASTAASGGYYIAANSDQIVANRNTLTGSIGVTIGTIYDFSGFLEKNGIKTETITAGDNKAMGSISEPLTDEQKDIYQSIVDESYDQFVGVVAEGRNLPVATVTKMADGRVYTAKQALENKLVDKIGTYEETMAAMASELALPDISFVTLSTTNENFLSGILASVKGESKAEQSGVDKIINMELEGEKLQLNYLSE